MTARQRLGSRNHMGWFSGFLKRRKAPAAVSGMGEEPPVAVGIGIDEPIEVSPGKFVTAREMTKNAVSPEEFDERLRAEAAANPELAKVLETHFGWKGGKPD